ISVALMLLLERLSPLERASFLLHDVFGLDFAEVSRALGRGEAACRQLSTRARKHIESGRPRFPASPAEARRLAVAFHKAVASGTPQPLMQILARDAVLYSDGGGNRAAALRPIYGAARILRFFAGIARKNSALSPPRCAPPLSTAWRASFFARKMDQSIRWRSNVSMVASLQSM